MLSKRKSRPIVVAENRFRYAISCRWRGEGEFDFNITVQSEKHNGSKLLVNGLVTRDFWLDFPNPDDDPGAYPIITPKHIESFVKRAIEGGWDFVNCGGNFSLIVENKTEFRPEG